MAIRSSHAGHGGKKTGGRWADSGALNVKMGWQEATLAREINDKIIKYTKTKDITDNSGTNSNAILANTSANIRNSGSGWHISNHLNAFNGSAHGVEVLYGADSDKYMAERVSKAISDATGLTNRGAKDGKWLYIANNSGINDKVLLIEWCFIDNKSDVDKLQKNMDKAIQAMLKCFDYNVKIEEVTTTAKPKKVKNDRPKHAVLTGRFDVGSAAEKKVENYINATKWNYRKIYSQERKKVQFEVARFNQYDLGKFRLEKWLAENNYSFEVLSSFSEVTNIKNNDRPKHHIETGGFDKGSDSYKLAKSYLQKNKWNFKEVEDKNKRIRFITGKFSQNDKNKFRLEKWLAENNYSYQVF